MGARVTLRPVEPRDNQALRDMYLRYRMSEEDWDTFTPEQQAYLLQDTDPRALDVYARSGCSFVAEMDGRMVGYVLAFQAQRGLIPVLGVRGILVSAECRQQGVGTALYLALRDAATLRGFDHVFTDISPDNQASLRLHEKVGFRLDREINARLDISSVRRSFLELA